METRLYLDTRSFNPVKGAPLKLAITKKRATAYIPLDIRLNPDDWDAAKSKVINNPKRSELNKRISIARQQIEAILFELRIEEALAGLTASEIRQLVVKKLNPDDDKPLKMRNNFMTRMQIFADKKKANTRGVYLHTISRLRGYERDCGVKLDRLKFEDITKDWLTDFENYLARTACKNSRNIHLRNIRAVFNDAIDEGITTFYPFRRFKIRPTATRKRALTVEQLRTLFNYKVEDYQREYLDMFKLMFMLIGINAADLFTLKEVRGGRIEYYRAKTNKLYSIKVEPEAMEIIERYRGKDWLLSMLDHVSQYRYYLKHMNTALQSIGEVTRKGLGGKKYRQPLFPGLSSYWSRHTWATIAASLDIPKETIARALGHGSDTVTDIYIDFDMKKVEEANRRVIDWVLYNKR